MAFTLAEHTESVHAEIVFIGKMIGEAKTSEEIVASVGVFSLRNGKESVWLSFLIQEFAVHLRSTRIAAHPETESGESIEFRGVIVDVRSRIAASAGIDAKFHASVVARLTVFLKHDIDDACGALRAVFRRGICDDLYSVL